MVQVSLVVVLTLVLPLMRESHGSSIVVACIKVARFDALLVLLFELFDVFASQTEICYIFQQTSLAFATMTID